MAESKWREILAEQAASGGTAASFCRERGLSAPQFFFWKRRLGEAPPEFVEVRIAAAEPAPIELRLAGGRSLVLPAAFDADALRRVLAVLEPGA
jgi:hypothetical protein